MGVNLGDFFFTSNPPPPSKNRNYTNLLRMIRILRKVEENLCDLVTRYTDNNDILLWLVLYKKELKMIISLKNNYPA